jgi:dethiobiotin synthetase
MGSETGAKRIVVIGTGTGVGKTWLSTELLRVLRAQGRRAIGLKPVESGVDPALPTDADNLARFSSRPPTEAPYRFAEPISPHLAARRSRVRIELASLLTYVQANESSSGAEVLEVSIIETAGGLFSPLAPGLTNWDFARALEPARWLLVAPDSLGVLHDLTATLTAARARGRAPDAIALCRARPPDTSTGTNADEVAELGLAPRPCVFPEDGEPGFARLLDALLAS